MYVARALSPSSNGKPYESVYLRESFREGARVRKRDIANLTHCDPKEIAAIKLALKFKGHLSALGSLDQDFAGQLALWQVLARVLDPGSRLAAVRLAQVACGLRCSRHTARF